MGKFIDLTEQKFGRLTVIERVEKPKTSKWKNIYWLCKCDCGNFVIVQGRNLKSKNTKSCGCFKKEMRFSIKGEASRNRAYYQYTNRGLTLTKDEFIELTLQPCFYCGEKPSNTEKNKSGNGDFIYSGIDKINPSKGYSKGNMVPCCWTCNQAKSNMNVEDFYRWINKAYNNLSNKGII